jgi:hypothetical protein
MRRLAWHNHQCKNDADHSWSVENAYRVHLTMASDYSQLCKNYEGWWAHME